MDASFQELFEQGERLLLQRHAHEASVVAHSILAEAGDSPRALHLAGLSAAMDKNHEAAVEFLSLAVRLEPSRAGWLADLGTVLFAAGRGAEAKELCLRALALDSRCEVAHDLLAKIALEQRRDYQALEHIRALATLRGDDPRTRARLALTEYSAGNSAEAIRLLRDLISQGRADGPLHSEYVSALLYDPNQSCQSLRAEFEEWAARFCSVRATRSVARTRVHRNGRMRIGYISGEFAATPSRHFLLPIFRHHDRERFEITLYHSRSREDAHTDQFRRVTDRWRNCAGMSDQELAGQIEADEIDILVDVGGHFRFHRLSVFGLRPAPVQVEYPNHPSTTGVPTIQYIFTDRWVCPKGAESQYTERVYPLSHGYLSYQPPTEAGDVTGLPCDRGCAIVFGLFQRPTKYNETVWEAVAGVLRACSNSRLLVHFSSVELDDADSPARDLVKRQLAARGVDPARVVYRGWVPLSRHLAEIGEADIALDTFPYNGTTTTCECLWMGVPVVTLTGQTHASRVGYEILDRVGLSNFAASSRGSYIDTAVGLAQHPEHLRHLRYSLRDQLRKSSLLNPEPLVREIEQGYSIMLERYVEENL